MLLDALVDRSDALDDFVGNRHIGILFSTWLTSAAATWSIMGTSSREMTGVASSFILR